MWTFKPIHFWYTQHNIISSFHSEIMTNFVVFSVTKLIYYVALSQCPSQRKSFQKCRMSYNSIELGHRRKTKQKMPKVFSKRIQRKLQNMFLWESSLSSIHNRNRSKGFESFPVFSYFHIALFDISAKRKIW